jgi:hypothetical protein
LEEDFMKMEYATLAILLLPVGMGKRKWTARSVTLYTQSETKEYSEKKIAAMLPKKHPNNWRNIRLAILNHFCSSEGFECAFLGKESVIIASDSITNEFYLKKVHHPPCEE